jgi:microcystin-dependent protein
MSEPFLGELRLFSFNFAPKGWALANGQFLPINQNQALFALLGTMYGGNGQTNFALPNLRGRVSLHVGPGFNQGQAGGEDAHTLTLQELPQHIHLMQANTANADTDIAGGATLGAFNNAYRAPSNPASLNPTSVAGVGGGLPHENRQPYTVLSWGIALQGIFPSPN